jgi:hypothetical protein
MALVTITREMGSLGKDVASDKLRSPESVRARFQ